MTDDPKKLVRGLKDISPLFAAVTAEPPVCRAPEVQVLAVSSPDEESDSLLLNTFFASQIASPEKPCSLVSVVSRSSKGGEGSRAGAPEPFGEHLQRYRLYWDELRDLLQGPSSQRAEGVLLSRDVFLDFEYRHLLHCEKAVTLLDKWVLLLKPTAESLTEGYKMMKAGLAIHPQLEFYIALSGKADESKGEMIFERFSDLTEKQLRSSLGWLGWMDLEDPERHFCSALHSELLRYQSWNPRPSLPKALLAGWIETLEKQGTSSREAGVTR